MVVLANVYALNVDDVDFLKVFFSSLPDLSLYSPILGGDFNCWLDPVLDRSSSNPGIMSKSASLIQSQKYGGISIQTGESTHSFLIPIIPTLGLTIFLLTIN